MQTTSETSYIKEKTTVTTVYATEESAVTTASVTAVKKDKVSEDAMFTHTLPTEAIAQAEYEDIRLLQFRYDDSRTVYDEDILKDKDLINKAKDIFIKSDEYAEATEGIRNDKAEGGKME